MLQPPSYWKVLTRRKNLVSEGVDADSKLKRVLNLWDLTALGVGSTLGAGVYVLAGQIAKEQAGPSVMLSFAIAAVASLLAGICYAEFGARVPKAGSAYIYSYVCIGEFVAFVIGWNLMLEYMIGTAAVCRGISLYLDTLLNDTLKTTFAMVAPMQVSFFGSYFDFFAFGLVVFFGVALAFGVETSTMANNFCTCLNISILLFVIIAGSIKANFANWTIDVTSVNATNVDIGEGGFFPFGFEGTLRGAATCFFGFVGFDCIATTGEEVRNPRKNIPRAILLSLLIIFLCYFGVSSVLTLMVPYYLQDANAPLPYAFKEIGWPVAMWVVTIGGLTGLLASLFGALFPLPRVMYSMAEDGLLFRFLGKVSARFQVPVIGSIFAAMLTASIAGLFDLAQLVNLLSIGTLLAYSVVAVSITILRYMDNAEEADRAKCIPPMSESSMLTSDGMRASLNDVLLQLFNCHNNNTPTRLSTRIVGTLITIFCLLSAAIGLLLMKAHDALINNQLWMFILLAVLLVLMLLVLFAICRQPREKYTRFFRVPFVPIVPAISIFINIYLMLQLDVMTWIRFGIWMTIGILMFIACWCMYDVKNRQKRNPNRVSFERALNESAQDRDIPNGLQSIEHVASAGLVRRGQLPVMFPNGITVINTRDEQTTPTFDEVVSIEEIEEDVADVPKPNGKIFFIDDSLSNSSITNYERGENHTRLASFYIPSDDEKSVIAILDDVLLSDAANKANTTNTVETTAIATVHSSSESFDKEGGNNEREDSLSSNDSLKFYIQRYNEAHNAASSFVEDMLCSDKLWSTLEQNITFDNSARNSIEMNDKMETKDKKNDDNDAPMKNELLLAPQSVSEDSIESDHEEPLHSEKFKVKLSNLIVQPPSMIAKVTKEPNGADTAMPVEHATLKQSKSAGDVLTLVAKAIEGTGLSLDENGVPKSTNAPNDNSTDSGNGSVPKPPKFDPVLYKTINSLGSYGCHKIRPRLNQIEQQRRMDAENIMTNGSPKADGDKPIVPFKDQLEAVLRRGPSHRSQQSHDRILRRPKSQGAALFVSDLNLINTLTTKSESNLNALPASAAVIQEALNALRPVPGGVSRLA